MAILKEEGEKLVTLVGVTDLWEVERTFKWETKTPQMMRLTFEILWETKTKKDGSTVPADSNPKMNVYSNEMSEAYAVAKALWFSLEWMSWGQIIDEFIKHIGSSCMVEVTNENYMDNDYVQITKWTYNKIPKQMKDTIPAYQIEPFYFAWHHEDWQDKIDAMPEYAKKNAMDSITYKKKLSETAKSNNSDSDDEDLPF